MSATPFAGEPAAHALYDRMVAAFRAPRTLSYESDYTWSRGGKPLTHAAYRAWLQKPNSFRIEARSLTGDAAGVIVGDGRHQWIYWLGDRPRFDPGDDPDTYEQTRHNRYMRKPAPPGGHSLGHEMCWLGVGMGMTIFDPSTFHGYTDSLQPYLDGIRALPPEPAGGEECDAIEVSYMNGQRSWFLWLSRRDGLPRRLREVVRVHEEIVVEEQWSDLLLNAEIPAGHFAWAPPAGWAEWRPLTPEERLLRPGTEAPDFELRAAGGGTIHLLDTRGQVAWINVWRCG